MTPALRKPRQLKLIWAGLAVLLVAFVISMGGLNSWQLQNKGVPVQGERLGSEVAKVLDCGRDAATLFQSYTCTVEWTPRYNPEITELRSLTELSGEVLVDVYSGESELVLVPEGMKAAWVSWMPTDVALVAWLVALVLAPMVVAVTRGIKHSSDSRLGPVNPFDAMAKAWDVDAKHLERAEALATAIRERVPAGGDWLDFGAGTGMLGISLLGHADTMVLADASAGMLATATEKVERLGLGDRVGVRKLDLAAADGPAESFDVVASLMALHHVPDVEQVVLRIAAMVRPGGHVALADLDAEDGSFHAHGHVRPEHDGIDRAKLAAWLTDAGLVDIDLSTPFTVQKNDRGYGVFLAVARKPA